MNSAMSASELQWETQSNASSVMNSDIGYLSESAFDRGPEQADLKSLATSSKGKDFKSAAKRITSLGQRNITLSNVGGSGHIIITENDNPNDLALIYCQTNGLDVDIDGPVVASQIQAKQLSLLRWKLSSTRKKLKKADGDGVRSKFMHAVNLLQRTQHDKKKQGVKLAELKSGLHQKTEELVQVLSDFETYKKKMDASLIGTKQKFDKYKLVKENQIKKFEQKSIEQMQKVVMEGSVDKDTDTKMEERIANIKTEYETRLQAASKNFEAQMDVSHSDRDATVGKLQREKKMVTVQLNQLERRVEEMELDQKTTVATHRRKNDSFQAQLESLKQTNATKDIRLLEMNLTVVQAEKLRDEATESAAASLTETDTLNNIKRIAREAETLAVASALDEASKTEEELRQKREKEHETALSINETNFALQIKKLRKAADERVAEEVEKAEKRITDAEKQASSQVKDAQSKFAKRRSSVVKQREELRKNLEQDKAEDARYAEEKFVTLQLGHKRELETRKKQEQETLTRLRDALREQKETTFKYKSKIEGLQSKLMSPEKSKADRVVLALALSDKTRLESDAEISKTRMKILRQDNKAALEAAEKLEEELEKTQKQLMIEQRKNENSLKKHALQIAVAHEESAQELEGVRKAYEVSSNIADKNKHVKLEEEVKRLRDQASTVRDLYKTKVTTIKENLSARAAKELNEAMARAKTEKKTTETKAKNAKLRHERQMEEIKVSLREANDKVAGLKQEIGTRNYESDAETLVVKQEMEKQVSDVVKELRAMEDDHAQELDVISRERDDALESLDSFIQVAQDSAKKNTVLANNHMEVQEEHIVLTTKFNTLQMKLTETELKHTHSIKKADVATNLFKNMQAQNKKEKQAHRDTKKKHVEILSGMKSDDDGMLVKKEEEAMKLQQNIVELEEKVLVLENDLNENQEDMKEMASIETYNVQVREMQLKELTTELSEIKKQNSTLTLITTELDKKLLKEKEEFSTALSKQKTEFEQEHKRTLAMRTIRTLSHSQLHKNRHVLRRILHHWRHWKSKEYHARLLVTNAKALEQQHNIAVEQHNINLSNANKKANLATDLFNNVQTQNNETEQTFEEEKKVLQEKIKSLKNQRIQSNIDLKKSKTNVHATIEKVKKENEQVKMEMQQSATETKLIVERSETKVAQIQQKCDALEVQTSKANKKKDVLANLFKTMQTQVQEEVEAHRITRKQHAETLQNMKSEDNGILVQLEEEKMVLQHTIVDLQRENKKTNHDSKILRVSLEESTATFDKDKMELTQSLKEVKFTALQLEQRLALVQQEHNSLKLENSITLSASGANVIAAKTMAKETDALRKQDQISHSLERDRTKMQIMELEKKLTQSEAATTTANNELQEKMRIMSAKHLEERNSLLEASEIFHSKASSAKRDTEARHSQVSAELKQLQSELATSKKKTEVTKHVLKALREQYQTQEDQRLKDEDRLLIERKTNMERNSKASAALKKDHEKEIDRLKRETVEKVKALGKEKTAALTSLSQEKSAHVKTKAEHSAANEKLQSLADAQVRTKGDKTAIVAKISAMQEDHAQALETHRTEKEEALAQVRRSSVALQQQREEHVFAKRESLAELLDYRTEQDQLKAQILLLETKVIEEQQKAEEEQQKANETVESLSFKQKSKLETMQSQYLSEIKSLQSEKEMSEKAMQEEAVVLKERLEKMESDYEIKKSRDLLDENTRDNVVAANNTKILDLQKERETLLERQTLLETGAAKQLKSLMKRLKEEQQRCVDVQKEVDIGKIVQEKLTKRHKIDMEKVLKVIETNTNDMESQMNHSSSTLKEMRKKLENQLSASKQDAKQRHKSQSNEHAAQITNLRNSHISQMEKLCIDQKLAYDKKEKQFDIANQKLIIETTQTKNLLNKVDTLKSSSAVRSNKLTSQMQQMVALQQEHAAALAKIATEAKIKHNDASFELHQTKENLIIKEKIIKQKDDDLTNVNNELQMVKIQDKRKSQRHAKILQTTAERHEAKERELKSTVKSYQEKAREMKEQGRVLESKIAELEQSVINKENLLVEQQGNKEQIQEDQRDGVVKKLETMFQENEELRAKIKKLKETEKEKDAMDEARLEAEMELTIQHRIIEELKQKHQEETNELKIKKLKATEKEKDAMDEARLEAEMELTIQHRIIEELKQKHQEETNELNGLNIDMEEEIKRMAQLQVLLQNKLTNCVDENRTKTNLTNLKQQQKQAMQIEIETLQEEKESLAKLLQTKEKHMHSQAVQAHQETVAQFASRHQPKQAEFDTAQTNDALREQMFGIDKIDASVVNEDMVLLREQFEDRLMQQQIKFAKDTAATKRSHDLMTKRSQEKKIIEMESVHKASESLLQEKNNILSRKLIAATELYRKSSLDEVGDTDFIVKEEVLKERTRINREISKMSEKAAGQYKALLEWKSKATSMHARAKKAEAKLAAAQQGGTASTKKYLARAISEYSAKNERRIELFKTEERKLRQDLQQKNDGMVLKLRSSLAEAVDSKTSTELETSRALERAKKDIERLINSEQAAIARASAAERRSPMVHEVAASEQKDFLSSSSSVSSLSAKTERRRSLTQGLTDTPDILMQLKSNLTQATSSADIELAKEALALYERTRTLFSGRLDALLDEIDRLKGTLPHGQGQDSGGEHYWHGCVKCQRQVQEYHELLEKSIQDKRFGVSTSRIVLNEKGRYDEMGVDSNGSGASSPYQHYQRPPSRLEMLSSPMNRNRGSNLSYQSPRKSFNGSSSSSTSSPKYLTTDNLLGAGGDTTPRSRVGSPRYDSSSLARKLRTKQSVFEDSYVSAVPHFQKLRSTPKKMI